MEQKSLQASFFTNRLPSFADTLDSISRLHSVVGRIRRASRKLNDMTLAIIGSSLLAVSFVFFMSRQTGVLYLGAGLLAFGNGLMWPSIVSMLSKAAGDKYQGAVQGFAGSFGAVASVVGLLAGGVLYASLESGVFLVSSGSIISVFFITVWLSSRTHRNVAA
jgi:MFS transporter, DHA1 family, tetracycline resistance protein